MYYCHICQENFEQPLVRMGGYGARDFLCPICLDCEFERAAECGGCGQYLPAGDLENGLCGDCRARVHRQFHDLMEQNFLEAEQQYLYAQDWSCVLPYDPPRRMGMDARTGGSGERSDPEMRPDPGLDADLNLNPDADPNVSADADADLNPNLNPNLNLNPDPDANIDINVRTHMCSKTEAVE